MKTPPIPLAEKYELVAAVVTLDGKPAKISGALRPYATVQQLPFGTAAEFAWTTVARIVAKGGAFQSGMVEQARRGAKNQLRNTAKGH